MDNCPTCKQKLPPQTEFTVDLDFNSLVYGSKGCKLTPYETVLMYCLKRATGHWVSYDNLNLSIYGAGGGPECKVLNVVASRLRRKFKKEGIPLSIVSNWYEGGGGGKFRLCYEQNA